MRPKVAPFAVHRHEIPRLHQRPGGSAVRPPGHARHVHQRGRLVHHRGSQARQAVDNAVDRGLVTGDKRRARSTVSPAATRDRWSRQAIRDRADRAALGTRRDQQESPDGSCSASRRSTSSPPGTRRSPGHWRRPCCGPSSVRRRQPCLLWLRRGVHDLLHAMHVGGETGHDVRRSAFANTSSKTGAISRSDQMMPGTSALVESAISRSTPSSPSARSQPGRSTGHRAGAGPS